MIKAICNDGSLLFGLSDVNLERLRAGDPIVFDLVSMGLPKRQVIIIHEKDEPTMLAKLRAHGMLEADAPVHGMADPQPRRS